MNPNCNVLSELSIQLNNKQRQTERQTELAQFGREH